MKKFCASLREHAKDYHFIIKELANKLDGQFKWLGENKEKYINFSVPIKKEAIKISKDVS